MTPVTCTAYGLGTREEIEAPLELFGLEPGLELDPELPPQFHAALDGFVILFWVRGGSEPLETEPRVLLLPEQSIPAAPHRVWARHQRQVSMEDLAKTVWPSE